jgi:hypothetical protein
VGFLGSLLDGYHRTKAYLKYNETHAERVSTLKDDETIPDPFTSIPCEYHQVPDGIPVKLYAGSLSCKHGLRWADGDKKETARQVYEDNPGFSIKSLARLCGITEKTAKKYVEDILARFQDTKRAVITKLDLLGWTTREIADKLQELWPDARGVSKNRVAEICPENGNDGFRDKIADDLSRGLDPATASKRYELPPIVVWAIKLQNMTDQARLKELGITHLPYDVWNFAGCHNLFGSSHPGRIPGELVAHTLLALTKPAGVDENGNRTRLCNDSFDASRDMREHFSKDPSFVQTQGTFVSLAIRSCESGSLRGM